MQRPIADFGVDQHGDPFACLSCGHRQHVRHNPPFTNRPWVTTEAGRRSKLGEMLDCVRCDRFEIPDGYSVSRRTPEFDEHSVPAGLLRNHTTKRGVWGRIIVTRGQVNYIVDGVDEVFELTPGVAGVVVPERPHRVEPVGAVTFHVEFWHL
jgi:tellurite resistance-related uncharacterized protein